MTEMTPERLAEHREQRDQWRKFERSGATLSWIAEMHEEAVDEIERQAAEIERLRVALGKMLEIEDPGGFIYGCAEEDACHVAINAKDFRKHHDRCPVRIAYDALNPEPTT